MPRTRSCDFCGNDIEPGTGTMFVRVDGSTTYFCSAKCEKNADLGREARDLEWTEAGEVGAAVPEEAEESDEIEEAEESEETEEVEESDESEEDEEVEESEESDEDEEAEESEDEETEAEA